MTPHSLIVSGRHAGATCLSSQSDDRLVELTRAGSEPAFEAIVDRYRTPLMRYCKGFVAPDRAEDAVQHTFLGTYLKLKSDEGEIELRPWLYRVARNTAIDSLRDRSLGHEQVDENFDGVERPDQAAERHESVRQALSAVQALPTRQRDAVVLRELDGRSYDEISERLGVSLGAARQLLARARTTLRAGLGALSPAGLLHRLPSGSPTETLGGRLADFCTAAGAGAGTVAAQLTVTAIVTGSVVGGAAVAPFAAPGDAPAPPAAARVGTLAPAITPSPLSTQRVKAEQIAAAPEAGAPPAQPVIGEGPAAVQKAPAAEVDVASPIPTGAPGDLTETGTEGGLVAPHDPVTGSEPFLNTEGTAGPPCQPGDDPCDPYAPGPAPPAGGSPGAGSRESPPPGAGMEGELPETVPAGG